MTPGTARKAISALDPKANIADTKGAHPPALRRAERLSDLQAEETF